MHVSEIRIYPVKGLGGRSMPLATVEPWGLQGDRRWMVIDAAGRFLTQRQCPAMATIEAHQGSNGLVLTARVGGATLTIDVPTDGPRCDVTVWDDRVPARLAAPEADRFLATALGVPCRLAYLDDPTARAVDPDYGTADDSVSFADGFPLLATTQASLDDLNARMVEPVPMNRFRANVVIAGTLPWAEDGWRRLRVGAISFDAVKPCARCAVTTIDQHTGRRNDDNEPIRTLQRFRRDAHGQVTFGQNLIPRGAGQIAVGDRVVVEDIETGSPSLQALAFGP